MQIALKLFFIALACVLIVSAVLKLFQLLTDPFADLHTGLAVPHIWLVLLVEVAAAIIMLAGRREVAWAASIVVFVCFCLFAWGKHFSGATSCGCFGSLEIPPLFIAIFDTVIVTLLGAMCLAGFVDTDQLHKTTAGFVRSFDGRQAGSIVGFLLIVIFVAAIPSFAQTSSGLIAPKRQPMHGDLVVNLQTIVNVEVVNSSSHDAKIVGSRSSCKCALLDQEIFQVIKSMSSETIAMKVTPSMEGRFQQRLICFLDHPVQDVLIIDLTGTAESPSGDL